MARAWQRAGRLGREAVHRLRDRIEAPEDRGESPAFPALHWMTAALFVAAGVEAALRARGARSPGSVGPRGARAALAGLGNTLRDPAVAAPLLAAPLAGAAHAARVLSPTPRTRVAARVLDGVAAGVAVAGAARAAYNALARGEDRGSRGQPRLRLAGAVAPLTFGATALLGLLVEHEEERERRQLERLRHRASVVERLVPRRKPRLDRIVLHI